MAVSLWHNSQYEFCVLLDEDDALQDSEMTEEEKQALLYTPNEQEWPECSREAECTRISACLEQVTDTLLLLTSLFPQT